MDRIQRKRERGFRLPKNTLCVDRGGKYGNPYRMAADTNRSIVIDLFRFDLKSRRPEMIQKFIDECEKKGIEHIACFCPVDVPCHGDVWLEVWNEYKSRKP